MDTNWLSNRPLGEWHGKLATDPTGASTDSFYYLDWQAVERAPIPSALGNLDNLERLSLWGNQLSGPIPSELMQPRQTWNS